MARPSGKEHPNYVHFSDEELVAMGQMYTSGGKSVEQIGNRYGISNVAVRRRLAEMGIEMRHKGRPRVISEEHLIKASQMRAKGIWWVKIAMQLKVNCSTLKIRYSIWEKEQNHVQASEAPRLGSLCP